MDEQRNQDIQDQDFERYGVWVKAGPEEVLEADEGFSMMDLEEEAAYPDLPDEEDGLVSLDDLDIEEPTEEADPFDLVEDDGEEGFDLDSLNESLDDDFENLDLDDAVEGGFDQSMPGSDEEIEEITLEDIDEPSSETLPELDEDLDEDLGTDEHGFTPEDQGIEIVPESARNIISPDEEEFLREEEDESESETGDLQIPAESAIPSSMDVQEREAFDRIQSELTDIKRELAELKEVLRGTSSIPREIPAQRDEVHTDLTDDFGEDEDGTQAGGTGFFEDEEDETIALTGDELDNILNTAEFTEEVGEAEQLDDDFLIEQEEKEEPASFVLEGDDSAVDELADMDIDQELAGIESLQDETEAETDESLDEIELDLDALDDMGETTEDISEDTAIDDLDLDEEDLAGVDSPVDTTADEPADDELELDDIQLEDEDEIQLDDDEPADDELELDDIQLEDEIQLEEPPVDTVPAEDDDLVLEIDDEDDLVVTDKDVAAGDDEGFDDFAAAVEHDLEVGAADSEEDFGEPPADDADDDADEGGDVTPEKHLDFDLEIVSNEADEESPLPRRASIADLPEDLKQEIRSVLSYMDQLLEALPDDKIEEFAQSEHFEVYKHLFEELGLET